jgi:very-short-patch-repair endonuclease
VRIPADGATELEWLLFTQQNVITAGQAARLLSPSAVRHRLATGRWRRVCRGVLVTHAGPLTRGQQLWIAVLSVRNAVLAGVAAAQQGGLRGFRDDPIDVLVPARQAAAAAVRRLHPDLPGVRVHRTGFLPREHRQRAHPVRTTIERSLVDAAQWARSDDQARALVAAGCQQKLVRPGEILEVVARMPRARRRALVIETARDAHGGATALSEISLVALCRRHRLPLPDLQRRRTDAAGRVRYLDAYWQQYRLQVEVDGGHHLEVGHWEQDMRRQNDIWVRGDRILRFSAYQVRHRPHEVVEQLQRALVAAGWRR